MALHTSVCYTSFQSQQILILHEILLWMQIPAHVHTQTCANVYYTHAYMHTPSHTCTPSITHTHTYTHPQTHSCTSPHTHILTHSCTLSSRYFHWQLNLYCMLVMLILVVPLYVAQQIVNGIRIGECCYQFVYQYKFSLVMLTCINSIESGYYTTLTV